MDKKRKWQLALILSVVALTIYNILPTLFFYAKPLKSPVSQELAINSAQEIAKRVDQVESDTLEWLDSYCQLLRVKPLSVTPNTAGQIALKFAKTEEAERLAKYLPRAGALISFFPAQLGVGASENPKEVLVQRRLGLKISPDMFEFMPKGSEQYQDLIKSRANAIVTSLLSPTIEGEGPDHLLSLASSILNISKLHEVRPELAGRLATFLSKSIDGDKLKESFAQMRDALKKEGNQEKKELKLAAAEAFIKKHPGLFHAKTASVPSFDLAKLHPLFSELVINGDKDQIELRLHPDVVSLLGTASEQKALLQQLLTDEAAKVANRTNERISKTAEGYSIPLHQLTGTTGVLAFKLDEVAKKSVQDAVHALKTQWQPQHSDLINLPIVTSEEYEALSVQDKALCLVVSSNEATVSVVAKGIGHILRSYAETSYSSQMQLFEADFRSLAQLLGQLGYGGYPGVEDYTFEQRNVYGALLAATRENFQVYGTNAILEFSDVEQRIIAENKIDTAIHEDLIKWKDEYRSSTVSLNPIVRFDVPEPTKSIFWSNFKLTCRKLVRGDERKVLRWGLDLSGGKSVQIELRDQNNGVVTDDLDLKQGINELFNRVNKMGVSDVSIRQVGHHIALDFPGSQSLSASELIKASSMYFHIVNEKFGPFNKTLSQNTDRFLQEVWNEAVVTGRKDSESIQAIAMNHLHGDVKSDAARTLLENGLNLEQDSKIVMYKGDLGGTHPLLVVFRASALEGSNLENIRSSYDASKGNFLSFEVKRSAQEGLYSWTSRYSKDKIAGTPFEAYSHGKGWRMAVLLNDVVISAPTLESAIRDSASINGSFSQREVNQLASDLKAGSLTFTPHILSEKNISPELGKSDRVKGIGATVAALLLVIISMVTYYRFAGVVASVAVIFNLLILWATLQNLGATLSLAGIAGIILTVGMAVDANVLVFERMKEEFAITGRIASSIAAGYEKAFTAIVDSNVTTIIAALILLNFDAGPIKAFAICMIIGIASSMFTALFMTRFYFNGWLKNPKHTKLSMASWVNASKFDFLGKARAAFATVAVIVVVGGAFLYAHRSTIFGMDFTGGYALSLELNEHESDRSVIESALVQAGASAKDFHIRHQQDSNSLQILFGTAMEQQGKPFNGLPLEVSRENSRYSYEKNPRIQWVADALQQADLHLASESLPQLDANWTAVSGQMSDSMRNNALIGLLLSFAGIFIYIAFRFEYKYAIAAVLCLLYDVLITLGLMGLLHAFKIPVQIDLNTIAALMTIIGYSLNDKIIVFDRIREDVLRYRNKSMREIVNSALNTTLSRTTITSGTTLLVLLALLFLGGASIFSFSLVMVIGVVFGTLSSWFIACPLMLIFHRKEEAKEKVLQS